VREAGLAIAARDRQAPEELGIELCRHAAQQGQLGREVLARRERRVELPGEHPCLEEEGIEPGPDVDHRVPPEHLLQLGRPESRSGQRGKPVGAATQCSHELQHGRKGGAPGIQPDAPCELPRFLRVVLDVGERVSGGKAMQAESHPAEHGALHVTMLDASADAVPLDGRDRAEAAPADEFPDHETHEGAVGDQSVTVQQAECDVREPATPGTITGEGQLEAVGGQAVR
jgi:hypothetical protein